MHWKGTPAGSVEVATIETSIIDGFECRHLAVTNSRIRDGVSLRAQALPTRNGQHSDDDTYLVSTIGD